jgi:hypothetical protein
MFVGGNFRDCQSTTKIAKISTPRKLPAIRYTMYYVYKATQECIMNSSSSPIACFGEGGGNTELQNDRAILLPCSLFWFKILIFRVSLHLSLLLFIIIMCSWATLIKLYVSGLVLITKTCGHVDYRRNYRLHMHASLECYDVAQE